MRHGGLGGPILYGELFTGYGAQAQAKGGDQNGGGLWVMRLL